MIVCNKCGLFISHLDLYLGLLNVGLTEGAKVLMKTLKLHIGLKIAQVHHVIRILWIGLQESWEGGNKIMEKLLKKKRDYKTDE